MVAVTPPFSSRGRKYLSEMSPPRVQIVTLGFFGDARRIFTARLIV